MAQQKCRYDTGERCDDAEGVRGINPAIGLQPVATYSKSDANPQESARETEMREKWWRWRAREMAEMAGVINGDDQRR